MNRRGVRREVTTVPAAYFLGTSLKEAEQCLNAEVRYASSNGKLPDQMSAKVIVLGDVTVGKTSLIQRFVRNTFERDYKATIGVDFEVETFEVLGRRFDLNIWDTAGQERFKTIASAYYRGANAIILAFDLAKPESLYSTRQWLSEAQKEQPADNCQIFLVGNKKDLLTNSGFETVVSQSLEVALSLKAELWPVSAKSGENVEAFFTRVAGLCFDTAARACLQHPHTSSKVHIGSKDSHFRLQQDPSEINLSKAKNASPCCHH